MSDKCPKCGEPKKSWNHSMGVMYECDSWGPYEADFNQSDRCRVRELEQELAMWRPLTIEEAQRAYEEAEAIECEPMSEERIAAIVAKALDPAERLTNQERAILTVRRVRELEQQLAKVEEENKRLREALGEAAIPLEALRLTEIDGTALCDEVKQGIIKATNEIRAAMKGATYE